MRDRDSKREADRERRARIKAGTWDFPNGARPSLQRRARQLTRRQDGWAVRQNRWIFRRNLKERGGSAPAPAPRPLASAPLRHVITSMVVDVVSPAPARAPSTSSGPPPSMVAIGGRPGRGLVAQGYGYPAPPDIAAVSTFTKWRVDTETMLATLAAKADVQERRIAALEASQADRRSAALDVARALAGLFSYAFNGSANAPRVALPMASTTSRTRLD